ncbi:hypothetical protein AX15_005925 [Amanita polypyramis BW_CC]|nr:hypothetical protein AX15_005925 [Amanita polypyramis BW_CC]
MLFRAFIFGVLTASSLAAGRSPDGFFHTPNTTLTSDCDSSGAPSCSKEPDPSNACCFEYPGGLILLTQFWDTRPSIGPSDSWTIHGLWPNHCDGTFDEGCDPNRFYHDLTGLVANQGPSDTLSFMKTYWVNNRGQTEQFWEHEWNKHGTCYSTLNPSCLPQGSPTGAEAVAFFQTVVRLFQQYNIYDALQASGITPTTHKTYSLSNLEDAISSTFGVTPVFHCSHGKSLNEVYIYFNLQGSVIDGTFAPIDAPSKGNCPSQGIRYDPKD